MEKKLVHFTTIFICSFSFFACVAVWFLPALEQRVEGYFTAIVQEQREREERYALLEKMSGLEILDYNTKQAQEQARKEQEQQSQQQPESEGEAAAEKTEKKTDKKGQAKQSSKTQKQEAKQPEVQVVTHQMHLELPKGTRASEVKIVQNYIDRQIRIEIPRADENYLYDYQMIGESDNIQSLDYSSTNGNGTILLTMKTIVEAQDSSDDDYLYLDFISPRELYDRIIVVDAGHGGSEPGAVSGEHYEKNITLAIVQQIRALFEKAADKHIGVYYTRLDDTNPSLSGRVGLANSLGADLFVSIHINSVKGDTTAQGVEVLYDEYAADTAFDTKDFAQICLDETVASLGARKRRLIEGHKIHIIRNSVAPVALVEVGFITNPNELENLLDPSYQHNAAKGVYQALLKSLKQLEQVE